MLILKSLELGTQLLVNVQGNSTNPKSSEVLVQGNRGMMQQNWDVKIMHLHPEGN